jgi:uncharacterized membrane protein YgcG
MVPSAALGTPAALQGGNFLVSVAGTAAGSIPHQIDLKVTQLPGGQLSEVTGFIVGPEDVVQVNQGENLIVSTSPDLMTHQVTVINMQGIPVDLVPLPSNVWSLQGLLPGVYTLNVNVAMSTSGILGTYETILVILEPDQQPLPPTTIINQITIRPPPPSLPPTPPCPNTTLVNGKCPPSPPPPPPPPPCDPNDPAPGEECICPEGTTGTPPNCIPIDCNVEDPPPECEEPPIECPDGSTVPPGEDCPGPPPENGEEPPEDGGEGDGGDNGGDGNNGGGGGDGSDGGNGGNGGDGGGTIDIPLLFG